MPSIGKDLVKIRKHLGLTLQDIQFATKLPQHTLDKIENDTIFVDAEEGPIYTRNFVRSYGRVLKIDDDLLIEALNLREAGKYNHELFRDFPELAEKLPEDKGKDSVKDSVKPASDDSRNKKEEPENRSKSGYKESSENLFDEPADTSEIQEDNNTSTATPQSKPGNEPSGSETNKDKKRSERTDSTLKTTADDAPKSGSAKPEKKPQPREKSTKEVDWANVGQKINQDKKQIPAWIIGMIILILVLGVAGYFVYQSGILSSESTPQQESSTPAGEPAGSSLSIELDEPQPQPQQVDQEQVTPEPVSALEDTLNIVVYAAFGNVDPIRVWSDTKPRFDPYWIEQGNAMTFDFEDTVQIRGPYDNMLIFMNGHLIENMVQNFYNGEEEFVELNRSDFTSDSKWSETTDLQVPEGVEPPLEIRSRPTF
ncbi:MAG TPA: helix-turn-helix domain-containing protein [Balneolaceae bacterium]|nr:helix-turn-helix domain-containing protein [Balneolaceae bacterium]